MQWVLDRKMRYPDAMYRPDLGWISFLWGRAGDKTLDYEDGFGIANILSKAPDSDETLLQAVEVLARGKVKRRYGPPGNRRIDITYQGFVVSLAWHRGRKTWYLAGWKGLEVQDLKGNQVKPQILESVKIDKEANKAAESPKNDLPKPTEAQKESGNYKKGHVRILGLDIAIENPAGSERSGVDPNGKKWTCKINHHYGDIKQTEGKDLDPVDVFLGPDPEGAEKVFVVNQVDPENGKFDEHKTMVGFQTEKEAREAYLSNYMKGWKGIGSMAEMTVDEFKDWLKNGDTKKAVERGDVGSYRVDKLLESADIPKWEQDILNAKTMADIRVVFDGLFGVDESVVADGKNNPIIAIVISIDPDAGKYGEAVLEVEGEGGNLLHQQADLQFNQISIREDKVDKWVAQLIDHSAGISLIFGGYDSKRAAEVDAHGVSDASNNLRIEGIKDSKKEPEKENIPPLKIPGQKQSIIYQELMDYIENYPDFIFESDLEGKSRDEIREFLEGIDPEKVKALKLDSHKEYLSVLKAIVRRLFPKGAKIQFRKDGEVFDYEHFLKDKTREEYIHTLPSTLEDKHFSIEFREGERDKAYFIKKYFDNDIQKDIWDIVVIHDNEVRTKIARKGRKGAGYLEKILVGAGNRASHSATPDGIKESASTHAEDTGEIIVQSKNNVKNKDSIFEMAVDPSEIAHSNWEHAIERAEDMDDISNIFKVMFGGNFDNQSSAYLKSTDTSIIIPMEKLVGREAPDPKRMEHAHEYMKGAKEGTGEKRKPISVMAMGNGKYKILDGNTTFHALQELGEGKAIVEIKKTLKQPGVETIDDLYEQAEEAQPLFSDYMAKWAEKDRRTAHGAAWTQKPETVTGKG